MNPDVVHAALDDWRSAPVDERLRSTLGFLEALTLRPKSVGPEDIRPMREAGVSDRAIEEAIYVCFLFNLIDRLADAFDFHVPDSSATRRVAWILKNLGYALASIPG